MEIKFTHAFFLKNRLLKRIMRSFIFLFCALAFGFTPSTSLSQNAKITIDTDKTITVDEVFKLIQDQTDYKFIYREDLFKNTPMVNVQEGTIKTYKLLDKSLAQSDVQYNFLENTIILSKKPIVKTLVEVQQITITGTVNDVNGEPIPGVNVLVGAKGSTTVRGVATDINGKYSVRASKGKFIRFSYVGFLTQEFEVTDKLVINVVLTEASSKLNEVVVVGYGTTQKKDLTGSVTTVKASEIEQIKSQSVERALYGKVPGVMVTGSGQPGSSASVNIRGLSQINGDNQPLYVIDGIPMNINANSRSREGLLSVGGTQSNPLLAINPADIENLTVLKDASAAAIYGSRAANGVIIVTTKRGKRGQKPRLNFAVNTTIQNPQTKYEFLSTDEYKDFYSKQAQIALDNSGAPDNLLPIYFPNQYNIVNDPDNYFGTANTDWQKEVQNENAMWNDYRMSLSGGTDNVNYYMSGNVQDQESVFINDKFKRYSFAANIDATITDRLKVGASINYNNSISKTSDITSFRYAGAFRPDVPVFDENGNYTDNGDVVFEVPDMNPVGQDGRVRNELQRKSILTSIYAEIDIVKNLKFRSQFSANQSNDEVNNYSPSFTIDAALAGLNGNLISYGDPAIGILKTQHNSTKNIIFTNTLTYKNTFNEVHNINAVAGLSWDSTENEAVGVNFAGFPDDFVLVNPESATHVYDGSSDFAQKALNSAFGRINYNYDDKYLVTATGRLDRSTQFGENNQTGFFPSLGLAWNMHNENFLKDNKTISSMKLRATAGRTGNDNLPAFLFTPVSAVEGGYGAPTLYNGLNGFRLQGVSNNGIRWEETDQIDLGIELGLFNNRLNAEIVWFNKKTSDLILLTPISAQTGFANYYSNIADVTNKGWEILVSGDIFRNEDLTWNSSFNASFITNNVDALKGGQSDSYNNYGVAEGYPIGTVFGRDIAGTAQTQAEIDALNAGAPDGQYDTALQAPGDFIARDINGDGEYTDADQVRLADGNQPKVFGGWNNTLSYKNFNFNFNFSYVLGLDKIRSPDEFLSYLDFNRVPNYIRSDVMNAWTPENPDAKYPRAGSRFWQSSNSRFVSDASYLSLRSASIGYNIPSEVSKMLGISNAKFTFTGNNLFIIHNYDGPNPESITRGVNSDSTVSAASDGGWGYPNIQSFTLGLNVTF